MKTSSYSPFAVFALAGQSLALAGAYEPLVFGNSFLGGDLLGFRLPGSGKVLVPRPGLWRVGMQIHLRGAVGVTSSSIRFFVDGTVKSTVDRNVPLAAGDPDTIQTTTLVVIQPGEEVSFEWKQEGGTGSIDSASDGSYVDFEWVTFAGTTAP